MRKTIRDNRAVLLSAALGSFLFLCIYGVNILNPGYDSWLMRGGDMAQHYLGWVAYRHSPWTFPLGMTEYLEYPYPVSIVFTDSIPLFAMLFKLLSPLLPPVFQYFGLWGFLCFTLNGALAAKLLARYLKKDSHIVLGSVFFILSFQAVSRMFVHTSLASHWLILAAMAAFVYQDALLPTRRAGLLWWGILAFLCSTIHLYFIPMCGIVLLGYCLLYYLNKKDWKTPLLFLFTYLAVALVTLWMLGSFTGEISYLTSTLGQFSFNLNSFFDSMDTGLFFPALKSFPDQYEGYAYLGAGILTLLAIAVSGLIRTCLPSRRFSLRRHKKTLFCAALICLAAVIVAASPTVTWGQTVLITYPLPSVVHKVWDAFRSSGRFSWICIYFIFLFAVCAGAGTAMPRIKTGILAVCLALQLMDLSPLLKERHDWLSPVLEYYGPAQSGSWDAFREIGALRHVLVYPDMEWSELKGFAELALKNGWTINQFYMARVQIDFKTEALPHMTSPREDTLYIWKTDNTLACTNRLLTYYEINGYIAGLSSPLSSLEALSPDSELLGRCTARFEGQNLTAGHDEDGVRYLEPGGTSYGPYASAPAGSYQVLIRGENLAGVSFQCFARGGELRFPVQNITRDSGEVRFELFLSEAVTNLEIAITNPEEAAEDAVIRELTIFSER